MNIWGSVNVLSKKELNYIEETMFRTCSEVGFKVEYSKIRSRLLEFGTKGKGDKVFFSTDWAEEFIKISKRPNFKSGDFDCCAGSYPQFYLPPGRVKPVLHNLNTMEKMVRLADWLNNVDIIYSSMGIPSDVSVEIAELYQRLIRWKFFKKVKHPLSRFKPIHDGSGLISNIPICKYLIEMAEIMATEGGKEPQDYCFADLYLISPLTFDKKQGEIFWHLFKKNFHSNIGTVVTLGGSAPITFGGAIALQLAEIIFCNIMQRIFFNIYLLNII